MEQVRYITIFKIIIKTHLFNFKNYKNYKNYKIQLQKHTSSVINNFKKF